MTLPTETARLLFAVNRLIGYARSADSIHHQVAALFDDLAVTSGDLLSDESARNSALAPIKAWTAQLIAEADRAATAVDQLIENTAIKHEVK